MNVYVHIIRCLCTVILNLSRAISNAITIQNSFQIFRYCTEFMSALNFGSGFQESVTSWEQQTICIQSFVNVYFLKKQFHSVVR